MKNLNLALLILLLLSGCASHNLHMAISKDKDDVLSKESLLRYTPERLKSFKSKGNELTNFLVDCHNGEIEKSLQGLKKSFSKYKDLPEYWNHIGTCYFLDENYSKAMFYYKKSLEVAKAKKRPYPAAHNNIGMILLKREYFNEARTEFEKALKIDPNLITPKFNLAQIYIKYSLLNKAEDILIPLHKASPKDVDILSSLATIWMMRENYKLARDYFSQISDKFITRPDIATHYSLCLYKLGELKMARDVLENREFTTLYDIRALTRTLKELINEEMEKEKMKLLKTKRG